MIRKTALALIFIFVLTLSTRAHTPGLSTLHLQHIDGELRVNLVFSPVDLETILPLDTNEDGTISTEEIADAKPLLDKLAANLLEVSVDGKALSYLENTCSRDEADNFLFHLKFAPGDGSVLHVVSLWMEVFPPRHRQFVSYQEGEDPPIAEDLLDAGNNFFAITLPVVEKAEATPEIAPAPEIQRKPLSFSRFFILGIEHILIGYDHLLFLFALLIVCEKFSSVLKIVTCFTVAHSLTLVLATLDIVQMRGSIVEPIIAASIVYVGVENILRRGDPKGRWILTFAFGLVHGFGFAGVLRELGIVQSGNVVMPLVSFNLGVEVGQIAVAAVILPVLWYLKKLPKLAPRFVPVCSVLVAAAGAYWFIERVWF